MLIRLDKSLFSELEKEWKEQCIKFSEDFADYAAPSIDLARSISSEQPTEKYGIYCLRDKCSGEHLCILHGNVARLPKSTGKTFRAVWVLLAPRFDFEDVAAEEFSKLAANLLLAIVDVATRSGSEHIKLHLGTMVDRQYFGAVAMTLLATKAVQDASIRGNWLHVTMRQDVAA